MTSHYYAGCLYSTRDARNWALVEDWITAGGANAQDTVTQIFAESSDDTLATELEQDRWHVVRFADPDKEPDHIEHDELVTAFREYREYWHSPDRKLDFAPLS